MECGRVGCSGTSLVQCVSVSHSPGSGKTLAYLAPLISLLRDEEEHCGLIPRLRRPRALILLPSRDLAAQVLSVAKSLCHKARFRAVGLIGGIRRVGASIYAGGNFQGSFCFIHNLLHPKKIVSDL